RPARGGCHRRAVVVHGRLQRDGCGRGGGVGPVGAGQGDPARQGRRRYTCSSRLSAIPTPTPTDTRITRPITQPTPDVPSPESAACAPVAERSPSDVACWESGASVRAGACG